MFSHDISEPDTGDSKQLEEVRDGNVVKGSLTVKEADGTTKVIEYSQEGADSAISPVVERIGEASDPQPSKTDAEGSSVSDETKSQAAVDPLE